MDETENLYPVDPVEDDEDDTLDGPILGDEAEAGENADEDGPKSGAIPDDAL